jgi:transposase-like protein
VPSCRLQRRGVERPARVDGSARRRCAGRSGDEFRAPVAAAGLRGVKLVISDAHDGLKAAVTKVLRATWQRCRVHCGRPASAPAGKTRRRIVSAVGRIRPTGTAHAQQDAAAAHAQWRTVADQLRPKVPKLAALMDAAEEDVLASMHVPAAPRARLHSTSPIERLNGEIKRRTDVVGIFPDDDAVRLIGAILLEQSDAWATQRARSMSLETIGTISDTAPVSLPALAS